jgi:ABC-2 type transport system permease protein
MSLAELEAGVGAGADARPGSVAPERAPRASWALGLFRSELGITLWRWRTLALLGLLALVPLLVGIAVRIDGPGSGSGGAGGNGDGPAFLTQVTGNGLFLVFASLAATLPFFLPMAVGVVAGDSIAGEAHNGTLRYLLTAPAGRTRLLLAKYVSVLVTCVLATFTVTLSALVVGVALFPVGPVTLLSGTRIGFGDGVLRALLVALVVAVSLAGIASVGLFLSTLTSSGIAAMAATVGLLVVTQITDSIPQLHAVQPYLFPHYWLSFADLLRTPVYWPDLRHNLLLQALYSLVFTSAAWARFTTRDVTT